jgi:hypothetical protein
MDRRRFPLPVFTNREDFVLPIGAIDDDTGAPFNLAGVTLAGGSSFTGSSWNVTSGGVGTTSSTTLTIPAYPIGSQLLAVTLTVGTGLAILPGQPVTIADPTGNNTMSGYVTSYKASSGLLVCQIGFSFQFEIRRQRPNEAGVGYVTWYDFGVQSDIGPLLSASLGNGILITELGKILVTIPEAQFKQLNGEGTYTASCTMTDSQNTRQMLLAALPVLQGGVSN